MAFVQQKAEPEIFENPYQGMGAEGGGALGMLEVIESVSLSRRTHRKERAAGKKALRLWRLRLGGSTIREEVVNIASPRSEHEDSEPLLGLIRTSKCEPTIV